MAAAALWWQQYGHGFIRKTAMNPAHPALTWLALCTCISSVSSPQCSAQLQPGLTRVSSLTSVGLSPLIPLLWWQWGSVVSQALFLRLCVPRLSPLKEGVSRCSLCCDKVDCRQFHKKKTYSCCHCATSSDNLLTLRRYWKQLGEEASKVTRLHEKCLLSCFCGFQVQELFFREKLYEGSRFL